MKKKFITIFIAILMTSVCTLSIAYAVNGGLTLYANSSSNDNVNMVYNITDSKELISSTKRTYIINSANRYSTVLNKDLDKTSENNICSFNDSTAINAKYDNTICEPFYEITCDNYTISISKDYSLRSYTDSTFDYKLITTEDEKIAENFILSTYESLNMEKNYQLASLNKFGENLWEAVLAKNEDGIFNYYDSIKAYFCPMQKKIAALRVHSMEYTKLQESSRFKELTRQNAKDKVVAAFDDVSSKNIVNAELVFVRPNNFFIKTEGSDIETFNDVTKAWKVAVEKEFTYFVYVDSKTGEIIGGDRIK